MSAARRRDERGGFAPIVAVLLGTGVFIGLLALTADVGNIMWERRQLQNGADASALALGQICAGDVTACTTARSGPELKALIDANSADGLGQLDATRPGAPGGLCGKGVPTPGLPVCATTSSYGTLRDCTPVPASLPAGVPYVEAYTRTLSKDSGSLLPSFFSRALVGGDPKVSVRACARVAWGAPGNYRAEVPITISQCEWQSYLTSPGSYAAAPTSPWPGYSNSDARPDWPAPSQEVVIQLHSPSSSTGTRGCALNGKDTAGGFGYVDPATGCSAVVTNGQWANIETGSAAPSGCSGKFASLVGKVVAVPVFDCLVASGSAPTGGISSYPDCTGASAGGAKSWYHIKGWAMFYLSGYKIGGSDERASVLTNSMPCRGGERCLSGWFVQSVLSDASDAGIAPPSDGFGAVVVKLAG